MGMKLTHASKYPARIFWSDEDESFVAIAEDLPGCSAVGDTQAEALDQLQEAIDAWIDAAEAAGNPVPPPSVALPASSASGKVLLRMPRDLHSRLARSAAQENVSLNQYIVYLLATQLAVREATAGTSAVAVGPGTYSGTVPGIYSGTLSLTAQHVLGPRSGAVTYFSGGSAVIIGGVEGSSGSFDTAGPHHSLITLRAAASRRRTPRSREEVASG